MVQGFSFPCLVNFKVLLKCRYVQTEHHAIQYKILEGLKLCVLNVDLFPCRLDEISGAASKEFGLEKAMEKMKVEWKDMYFEFIPYRDTVSGLKNSL